MNSEGRKERESLRGDVARYRELARQLTKFRDAGREEDDQDVCADVHVNISLKHNHIVNAFAHLIALDDLLTKQGDLFYL